MDWKDFLEYELQRRSDQAAVRPTTPGIDAVFICVRDELHAEVVTALAPLGLHVMCEKPLATTLNDCLRIRDALQSARPTVFGIGHVLRYSPHNLLLRHLMLEERAIGDVVSIEHTEPVGWWHFSHSYVRGHWRKESKTAPSLLTKSCHDIDFLLWMFCSSPAGSEHPPHLPSTVTSTGSLKQFRRSRKPQEAGEATNCLSCPIKGTCIYSAPRIYYDRQLAKGITRWPVEIVNPQLSTILAQEGPETAKRALMDTLSQDYDARAQPVADIESRPWFGRCVWESDNDVCDDQSVTFAWEDEEVEGKTRLAKTAVFHMIAQTLAQCERRGYIYGTHGEIRYDSRSIVVNDFRTDESRTYKPEVPKNSHHGGGDDGLTQQFLKAVAAVKGGKMVPAKAQAEYVGCSLDEIIRSHAAVFAAEEARQQKKVVKWEDWWAANVDAGAVTLQPDL